MAITITPTTLTQSKGALPKGPPSWLFAFIIFFFLAAVGSSAVLMGLRRQATLTLENIQQEMLDAQTKKTALGEEVAETNRLAAQLSLLSELLKNHRRGRNAFTILEERVHPEVRLDEISVSYPTGTIAATVVARSMQAAAEQLSLLSSDAAMFQSVHASGFMLAPDGAVSFGLKLVVQGGRFIMDEFKLMEKL